MAIRCHCKACCLPEIVSNPYLCGRSMDAYRRIRLCHKRKHRIAFVAINVHHGDLLILQDKRPEYTRTEADADALSAAVWRAAWPRQRLQQRAFFTFGQKMLLALDLQVLGGRCIARSWFFYTSLRSWA